MSKCQLATLIIPAMFSLAGVVACGTAVAEATLSSEMRTHQALRVLADPPRARRWELGLGEVFVYDTVGGALIRRIRLPGASFSGARGACLPGMVLTRDGALIVSSNAQPALWRISPTRFELERFEVTLDSDQDKDFGFSTLAWADDGTLRGTSSIMGTSWRIDLESASAIKIAVSPALRGSCR